MTVEFAVIGVFSLWLGVVGISSLWSRASRRVSRSRLGCSEAENQLFVGASFPKSPNDRLPEKWIDDEPEFPADECK